MRSAGEGVDEFLFSDFRRLDELVNVSDLTKQASESTRGTLEIATQAETDAGTDDFKAITSKKLANMPFRIRKKYVVTDVSVSMGDITYGSELFDLDSNIGIDNYMVTATYNDNSLTSVQPLYLARQNSRPLIQSLSTWM